MLASTDLSDESTSKPPDALVGTTVAGRYRIEHLLGSGGMGSVYRAEHVHMRKTVALKVMHPELARLSEVVTRFEREAIAAARIEHPNVAAATDFGKLDDGSFYLVLEYVEGQSLRDLLKNGALELPRALDIARQIAAALQAAHAAGIVHRDLKPDNVMLIPRADGGDRAKVLDFGIAKVAEPDVAPDSKGITRVGVIMGTAEYMSPEQAVGQNVDERTDLYALGVVLYEMIAGHVPFQGQSAPEVLTQQLTQAPVPLETASPELWTLVKHLLEKNAGDRPASATAVLDSLDALAKADDGTAPGLSVVSQSSKGMPPERKRALIVAATVGGAAVLGIAAAWAVSTSGNGAAASSAPVIASHPPAAPAISVLPSRIDAPTPPIDAKTKSASADAGRADESAAEDGGRSAETKTSKAPAKAKTAPKAQKQRKRKTGPGGIYIPPPSEWF